jgi:hypothetical protein
MRLRQWPARAPHKESMAPKLQAVLNSEFALQVYAAIDRQPAGPSH